MLWKRDAMDRVISGTWDAVGRGMEWAGKYQGREMLRAGVWQGPGSCCGQGDAIDMGMLWAEGIEWLWQELY